MTRIVNRLILPLLMLAAFGLPASSPAQADQGDGLSAAKQARVRGAIERYVDEHDVPGMSFAISRGGELLYASGIGEASEDVPATEETIYPIGTISQQFTAALILYLQNYGLGPNTDEELSVQDPVTEYFFGITHWQEADIGNLLTHTSGIPSFTDSVFYRERLFSDVEAHEVLNFIKGRDLKFQPGESFDYSDSNYFLLANVVEIALRVYFYDHMRTEIFDQLELENTSFLHLTPLGRRASGTREGDPVPEVNHHLMLGTRDITSNVLDLVRWDRAIMHSEYFGEGARDNFFGRFVALPNIGAHYGAGWFVRRTDPWHQYFTIGFFPGFSGINKIYANQDTGEDYAVVILANRQDLPEIEVLADTVFIYGR